MERVPNVAAGSRSISALPAGPVYDHAYKRMWIAYALVVAGLGVLGAHRFYLLYHRTALMQLFLAVIFVFAPSELPSTIAGLALVAWMLVDLFLIPGLTRERNAEIAEEIGRALEAGRGTHPR